MRRDDLIRVRHMLDGAKDALRFVSGKSRDDLDGDRMLTFSLVKSIEIVGEAAARVTKETRHACPEIPWRLSLPCGVALFTLITT